MNHKPRPIERYCVVCRKPLNSMSRTNSIRFRWGRQRKYCSNKCGWVGYQRNIGKMPVVQEEESSLVNCAMCNNPFVRKIRDKRGRLSYSGYKKKYCSSKCAQAWLKRATLTIAKPYHPRAPVVSERIGNLTIIKTAYLINYARYVWCHCHLCGSYAAIRLTHIKRRQATSCGCYRKANSRRMLTEIIKRNTGTKRQCNNCGELFVAFQDKQKTCSDLCRTAFIKKRRAVAALLETAKTLKEMQ